MSPALDSALTIGGFIVSGAVFVFLIPWGLYMAGVSVADETQSQPPPQRSSSVIRVTALAIPPIVLAGVYVLALAMAWLTSGVTFYYPLIALVLGFAAWYAAILGLTAWYRRRR
ncbi:hypothetical protein [Mycobacterium sp. 1423905.2]|uniref:hypothetical protein n=1 Tax=Mycobacterium sp. 1423905.2 TaxID=1856859 RepID=UPI0007FD40B8|nr:hypothetical protein [Mycobacterium sp. 1423905.2]OBJ52927.1 hypothetical protein A9W95_19300 [Mycobacterium sp. 1423905.2]